MDREALIKGVLNGYGKKASSIADGMPWYNEATEVNLTSKMDEAKSLLDDAGWIEGSDGIREKDGQRAAFELMYPSSDSVRQSIVLAVVDQLKPLGLDVTPVGHGWDVVTEKMHSTPTLLGLGGYDPYEMYTIYDSTLAGQGWNNPTFYLNEKVDAYFSDALKARSESEALDFWKKAQWDGTTGLSALGDEAWTWLVNLDHIYFVRDGIDIGSHKIQPHGHGWPVADNLQDWTWK